MAPSSEMPGFEPVSARTWLHNPALAQPGQLIILCTWLGAAQKHVAKYTALYQHIAPGARILLIRSDVAILVSSYAKQRAAIDPSVSVVLRTLSETRSSSSSTSAADAASGSEPRPKILLHAFSNGGTNTATQLLLALRARAAAPLPLDCLVFDSCPAKGTYWKSYTAMVLSLPGGVAMRLFGALAVHSILLLLYVGWIGAMGNENPASLQRRTLLDEDTVGLAWRDVRRDELGREADADAREPRGRAVYLYSRADSQVDWTDVRDHAAEARRRGLDVMEVLFEGSGHCAHYTKHADRYAKAAAAGWGAGPDAVADIVKAIGPRARSGSREAEPARARL